MCVASGPFVFLCEPMVLSIHAFPSCLSVSLSPLFPTTVLLGHLLLWSLSLPASRGSLRGFLSTPYSASLSLTIYSDIPDTGKLLEYERGMLIRES